VTGGYSNPFDRPLDSEIQEHQQQQAATVAASPIGNPFDEPLASEKAEAHLTGSDSGQITNDVGNAVIVPKDGESFADTMQRAAQYGKTVTPSQVNEELATAPAKVAQTLGAAAGIGVGGTAALAVPGEVADIALKHLAGNVLPEMEYEPAKQTLIQALPRVAQFAETMGKLGIGAGGLTYLVKSLMGDGKK
jgi:hypothetical protein